MPRRHKSAQKLSYGSVRPAVLSLARTQLVQPAAEDEAFRSSAAPQRHLFKITSLGRQVLAWEVEALELLGHHAAERTKKDLTDEIFFS